MNIHPSYLKSEFQTVDFTHERHRFRNPSHLTYTYEVMQGSGSVHHYRTAKFVKERQNVMLQTTQLSINKCLQVLLLSYLENSKRTDERKKGMERVRIASFLDEL